MWRQDIGEVFKIGEPSMILTHPIKMQPLYLVWEINVLVTKNKFRKKRGTKIIAIANPNENPTHSILVCLAGDLIQPTELSF